MSEKYIARRLRRDEAASAERNSRYQSLYDRIFAIKRLEVMLDQLDTIPFFPMAEFTTIDEIFYFLDIERLEPLKYALHSHMRTIDYDRDLHIINVHQYWQYTYQDVPVVINLLIEAINDYRKKIDEFVRNEKVVLTNKLPALVKKELKSVTFANVSYNCNLNVLLPHLQTLDLIQEMEISSDLLKIVTLYA